MVSYKALNTTSEAVILQARDGVGKGDRGQSAATSEAVIPQSRDGIGETFKRHCFGNHHIACIFTFIRVIFVLLKGDSSRHITCV